MAKDKIPRAARVTDSIKHNSSAAWAIGGFFVGLLVGLVIVALVVGTGGLAAAFAIGVLAGCACVATCISIVCTAAVILSELCEFAGQFHPTKDEGRIKEGAKTVTIELLAAARAKDPIKCSKHGDEGEEKIAQGSETVSIEGEPAARYKDETTEAAEIEMGAETVGIGGPKGTYLKIHELPEWFEELRKWTDRVGIICGIFGAMFGGGMILASRLLVSGYLLDGSLYLAEWYGEEHNWPGWAMWPIRGVKSAVELALIFKGKGGAFTGEIAELSEIKQVGTEAKDLQSQIQAARDAGMDAEELNKLQKQLDEAKDLHSMEHATDHVKDGLQEMHEEQAAQQAAKEAEDLKAQQAAADQMQQMQDKMNQKLLPAPAEQKLLPAPAEQKLLTGPPEQKLLTGPPEQKLLTGPPEQKLLPAPSP